MNLTSNQWLFQNQDFLFSIFEQVVSEDWTRIEEGCLISTRTVSSQNKSGENKSDTKYPVIKRRCPDKVDRRCYCPHISYMSKYFKKEAKMWDSSEFEISHECHNTLCVNPNHLELLTKSEHSTKRIHCIGIVKCHECGVQFILCEHRTRCLTTKILTCSSCLKNN